MSETANRRASWGFSAIAAIFATHYFGWGGEYGLSDIRELRSERETVTARVDSLTAIRDSIQVWADSLESDRVVIERIAREEHAFIRPGERLYLFVSDEPISEASSQ